MKLFDLIMIVTCVSLGVAAGTIIQNSYVRDSHLIALNAERAAQEWKRLFCASTEGKISMVCQKSEPSIVKPTLERTEKNYRRTEI